MSPSCPIARLSLAGSAGTSETVHQEAVREFTTRRRAPPRPVPLNLSFVGVLHRGGGSGLEKNLHIMTFYQHSTAGTFSAT
jgi:hypothetical protein